MALFQHQNKNSKLQNALRQSVSKFHNNNNKTTSNKKLQLSKNNLRQYHNNIQVTYMLTIQAKYKEYNKFIFLFKILNIMIRTDILFRILKKQMNGSTNPIRELIRQSKDRHSNNKL